MADITVDTATRANISDIATDHVAFDWKVDFEAQVLSGSATHVMKVKKAGVEEAMWVDSADILCSYIPIYLSQF